MKNNKESKINTYNIKRTVTWQFVVEAENKKAAMNCVIDNLNAFEEKDEYTKTFDEWEVN